MQQHALADYDWDEFYANVEIEDGEPVDNLISAKQMRLLVEPLYSSWRPVDDNGNARKFFADADVGVFYSTRESPVVPDVFVSLDVEPDEDFKQKKNRSYFVWEFGKPPEVAVEIVLNRKGNEMSGKMQRYAKVPIAYYVVFDPLRELNDDALRVYELGFGGRRYLLRKDFALPNVGLRLTLWRGEFEGYEFEWMRWCDADGNLLLTGKEQAELERKHAEAERTRAEAERTRADDAEKRALEAEAQAAKFAAKLRELGIDLTA